eukprot:6008759-Prymnesium_polylepis.1
MATRDAHAVALAVLDLVGARADAVGHLARLAKHEEGHLERERDRRPKHEAARVKAADRVDFSAVTSGENVDNLLEYLPPHMVNTVRRAISAIAQHERRGFRAHVGSLQEAIDIVEARQALVRVERDDGRDASCHLAVLREHRLRLRHLRLQEGL